MFLTLYGKTFHPKTKTVMLRPSHSHSRPQSSIFSDKTAYYAVANFAIKINTI